MSLGVVAWKSAHLPKPGTRAWADKGLAALFRDGDSCLGSCRTTTSCLSQYLVNILQLSKPGSPGFAGMPSHWFPRPIHLDLSSLLDRHSGEAGNTMPCQNHYSTCQRQRNTESSCKPAPTKSKTPLMSDPSSSTTVRRHPALRRLLPDLVLLLAG